LDSVKKDLNAMGVRNRRQVTGPGPTASNRKKGQGLSWTGALSGEEEEHVTYNNKN
jgi:hypothetical protein